VFQWTERSRLEETIVLGEGLEKVIIVREGWLQLQLQLEY